jgi:GT2 family glycosyltransferase
MTSVCATAPKDSEIILVSNEPSAQLAASLKDVGQKDPRVVVISVSQNLGVVAKNVGYIAAQGEYILSIDGDVIPNPGWVEKLVSFMDLHPEVGLVGPCGGTLLVNKWGPNDWPVGAFDDAPLSYHGYEDTVFFGDQTVSGVDGKLLDVIPSMVWCFRRSLLAKIGYLDWRFGPFVGSDSDFCFRIKLLGMKVAICRTPVSHLKSGGSSHSLFSDLEELRVDHVAELRRRWYPHAHVLCELYKVTGDYVPPK